MTKALFPNPKASGITITGMTTDVVDFDQGYGQVASERFGEKNRIINAKQGLKGKTGDLLGAAARAIDSKMINMRTAFKYLDTDGSRTLSRQEIERGCACPRDAHTARARPLAPSPLPASNPPSHGGRAAPLQGGVVLTRMVSELGVGRCSVCDVQAADMERAHRPVGAR
eukprot:7280475-Prymnesium_polylepis.1